MMKSLVSLAILLSCTSHLAATTLETPAAPAATTAMTRTGPAPEGSYAIVVSKKTFADAAWKRVVGSLQKKYQARLFVFDYPKIEATKDAIASYAPHYVCFVAQPSEAGRDFVQRAARFMREIDPDPYVDAIWAILTGYTPDDALRMVTAQPLVVSRGVSHVTDGWLRWFDEGVSWSEVQKNHKYTKAAGEDVREVKGPDDTVPEIVAELNRGTCHIMSSSGHAREHDWQLGFTYPNGHFISKQGKLFGRTTKTEKIAICSPNSKIYYSPGNCLIAHISDMDCMSLAWMHSGGVNQFFGHVVPQYRCCWAWEVGNYFFTQQGRFTFSESVHLFRQDVIARLTEATNEKTKFYLTSDRDSTVLYGDPAWQARMKPVTDPNYDQKLSIEDAGDGKVTIRFAITARRECAPTEPAGALLPFRIRDAKVLDNDAAKAVVGRDFVLLRLLQDGEHALVPTDTRTVTISAVKIGGPSEN
ncbi:MAG: hypothetical protein LLG00_03190 [Planctomycetaceae bacterium]|nr:hypothetical protein [Planctomycetaceae bacterium]